MNEIEKNNEAEIKQPAPNEQSGFVFSSSVKIFDPNTEEVMVQMRGDD